MRDALQGFLLLCSSVVLCGGVPIDDVPPSLDVIGAHVLIFQVVGVLPNVNTENGLGTERNGRVLIRCRIDGQLAVLDDEPSPSRAEAAQASGGEFFLEPRESPEGRLDSIGKLTLWLTAAALLHLRPEQRMVPVAAGIVTDGGTNVLRDGVETLQKVFKRLGLEIGVAIERFVQVGHISAMVLVMVNFHGLGINVGFECVE